MSVAAPDPAAAVNRRRYEALRSTGGATAAGLPAKTPLGSLPIATDAILQEEPLPPDRYCTGRLRRSEMLRILDPTGTATPAMVAWRAADPSERINVADTIKVQWTASLRRGRVILSDMGRVLLSIVEDTSGAHDVLAGGSVPVASAGAHRRNTRENLIAAAAKLGLERRDLPPLITFFAPLGVDDAGRFRWQEGNKNAGDFVEVRAEMDLLFAVSNCRHPFMPDPGRRVHSIQVIRHRGRRYGTSDPCRTSGAEVMRAFELTDRLDA